MTTRLLEAGSKDTPVVKVTVQLDKNGYVSVKEAYVWGDIKEVEEGVFDKLKGFFGGKNTTEEEDPSASTRSESSSSTSSSESASESTSASSNGSGSESTSATSSTTTTKPTPTLSAKERSKIKLTKKTTHLGIPPMSLSEIIKSQDRYVYFLPLIEHRIREY